MQQNNRSVDHLVLPVFDLDRSRARFAALGFTVAANGYHPFGTVNACIFLPDQTYLEPLAIANTQDVDTAIANGNVFVARDRLFRHHKGEGVSAIVMQSDDAMADDAAFRAAGVCGGDMLQFSRPVRLPDGRETISSFHLAFAAKPEEETFFLFSCQRLNPLPADRASLETHRNGVIGLKRVMMKTGRKDAAELMQPVLGGVVRPITNGHVFETKNVAVDVTRANAAANDAKSGLLAIALVFRVTDLEVTAAVLAANGVDHLKISDGIVVPAAPGQGVAFLFEESEA